MKVAKITDVDFTKGDGLIPVVAQDATTGTILMVAYATREAVEKTLQTRDAYYFSRSRQKLWRKGEDSGHTQRVKQVMLDCDSDALIYIVNQTGPACHTGEISCFFRKIE